MAHRRIVATVGLAAVVAALGACGGGDDEENVVTSSTVAVTTTAAPPTTTTTLPPTTTTLAYVIQRGDTLSGIAKKHGISQKELADANGITDPDKIEAGDTLVIPAPTSTTLAPAVPSSTSVVNPATTVAATEVGEATTTTSG